jgi:hypothetical protein
MAVRGSWVGMVGSTVSACATGAARAGMPRANAADARSATTDFMKFSLNVRPTQPRDGG